MYNKIASIILNSGKNNNYAGEVFVSQPDATKERLAGKIFVLAEIEGKKSETQKIINFLVNIFDYNYYGDEKILLRDKIEGLKIEDIFETVLARVNQGLVDFLNDERLKINPDSTNLTLGVIHEDKLYFSNYGKNKAFLIYRRKGDYEIINIESNTTEGEAIIVETEEGVSSNGKIFSAVINGEIPAHSYFLFTNEALPEYLSNREMVNIITKLPPMVAAEQIKNFLQKINSFAPFLGIIVKSTIGTGLNDFSDNRDEIDNSNQLAGSNSSRVTGASRNAHSSISHLNYTEQKTENMLAPAGIINLKKIFKGAAHIVSKLKVEIPENKKVVKFYDEDESVITPSPKDNKKSDLARRDSFMIKEKIVFRKKSFISLSKIGNFFVAIGILFTPNFWTGIYQGLKSWVKNLGKKDRILVGSLAACFLILVVSIVITASGNKTRLASKQFNDVITDIDNKQAQINLYTAVNNNTGAAEVLNNSIELLKNSAPQGKDQQAKKDSLLATLLEQSDKLQKITKVDNFQEVVSANSWNAQAGADNLVFLNNQLYIADSINKSIYNFNLKDSSRNQLALTDATPLASPSVSDSTIYYLAGSKIVKVKGQTVTSSEIGGEKLQGENLIQYYNETLYLLSKTNNQIYKYNQNLTTRSNWFKGLNDLSQVSDFKVNGQIVISQNNADLIKFNKGQLIAYKTAAISPAVRADKLIITTTNYYLLDLTNNRLINLTKDGVLVNQYRLVKDNIKDFAIDEASKSAYILSGTTVYKFGL